MKKNGIILLIVCLVMGNFGFAGTLQKEDVSQKILFTLSFDDVYLSEIYDFVYNPNEKLIYVVTEDEETLDAESYIGYQFTFDLEGNFDKNPDYPEIEDLDRMGIAFEGDNAYSLEYDDGTGASYVYNARTETELGKYDESGYDGFAVSKNQIAFHRSRSSSASDNFDIGTLDPFVSSGASVKEIGNLDGGRIAAFDFSPSGTEFIYGAFSCGDDGIGAGFRVKRVSPETGNLIDEFLLDLPSIDPDHISGTDGMYNAIRGLYATDDYIVVMTKVHYDDIGFIQRYTYEGELLEGIETDDDTLRFLTEGPNHSALYLYPNEDNDYLDVIQVKWTVEEKSVGRPKSVISERSFGGKTLAEFKDTGFGLLKIVDPETGAMDYQAPLKSDKNDVRLRISFADMQAKLAAGANHLLINYMGQEIAIPMSAFDCADLLAGMPCQDDATIEIHLLADEAGNVTVTVQLFVVEQVDSMTKVVHRKTIQY